MVHLYLKPSLNDQNLLQISQHEDFYHPDDIVALILPPLISLVHLFLWIGTMVSIICARVFQVVFGAFSHRVRLSGADRSRYFIC